jgi:transcriptional regulator with XRE-family HTH domain
MKDKISEKMREFLLQRDAEMDAIEAMETATNQDKHKQVVAEEEESLTFYEFVSDLILDFQEIRKQKQLTQADIAQKMGTHQAVVSRFEKFKSMPSLEFVFNYAKALDVSLVCTPYSNYTVVLPKKEHNKAEFIAQNQHQSTHAYLTNVVVNHIDENSAYPVTLFKKTTKSCHTESEISNSRHHAG